jgi:hypothetical protein
MAIPLWGKKKKQQDSGAQVYVNKLLCFADVWVGVGVGWA